VDRGRRISVLGVPIVLGPWLLLSSLAAALVLLPQVWHQLTLDLGHRFVDLQVYREAGVSLLHHRKVYSYLTPPPQNLPFTYPPTSALLAVPLALLPRFIDDPLWLVGTYVLLLSLVLIAFRPVLRRVGELRASALLPLIFLAMAYVYPVRSVVQFGQVGLILVSLCVADCIVPDSRLRWPRGALVGLATAMKLTPGVFIPYLWLTGRRRAAYVAAGTFAGLVAVTWAIAPGTSGDYWTDKLYSSDRLGDNAGISNQSLRAFVIRSVIPHSLQNVVLLLMLVVVGGLGYWRARRASLGGNELVGITITGFLAALLSPVAWIHHLTWVVLAVGVIVALGDRWQRVLLGAIVTLFFSLTIPWWTNKHLFAHVDRSRISFELPGSSAWQPITTATSSDFPDGTRFRTLLPDGSYRGEPGPLGARLAHCMTTTDPVCSIPRHDESHLWAIRLVESSYMLGAVALVLLLPLDPVPVP
jgi:alpha-1,2-mannosyltransferase